MNTGDDLSAVVCINKFVTRNYANLTFDDNSEMYSDCRGGQYFKYKYLKYVFQNTSGILYLVF